MENKPQWMLDAERMIQEFNESELGKKDERQIKAFSRSSLGGKVSGKNNVKNNVFGSKNSKATKALKESGWYESDKHIKTCSENGKRMGLIQGAINKERKWMQQIASFESRSKGGKTIGQMHLESGHWAECQKKATEASISSRINRKNDLVQQVSDKLPNEFTSKDLRKILIEMIGDDKRYKAMLKNSKFFIKIHEGSKNQFDPPIYRKIK